MKLFNPLQMTDAPDHMVVERQARFRHIVQTIALAVALGCAAILITPFVAFVWKVGAPLNRQSFGYLLEYVRMTFSNDFARPHRLFVADASSLPIPLEILPGHDGSHLKGIAAYVVMGLAGVVGGSLRHLTNPHKRMVMKANGAMCTEKDLRTMEGMNQVGIRGGFLGAIGKWPTGLRKGQMVRMIEPLSCLCLAPPGTGKTAGVVVPTILSCPDVTFIINDPKPEIWEMTGGFRQGCSHVFMMNWSKVDDPENGLFYPRFNFLSPKLVPPPGPDRDTYLDSVAKTLIAEKGGGGDSYFVDKGRAALTGFMHLMVVKINEARDYSGVPTPWVGKEASIPMLNDWLAQAQFDASKGGGDEWDDDGGFVGPDDERPPKEEKDPNRDIMKEWLQGLCASVDPSQDGVGRSTRAFIELSPLILMADKERSGVLGTMDQALIPFKNEAVKQRTSACDFTPDDMRGIIDPAISARLELPPRLPDGSSNPAWLDPAGAEYRRLHDDKANWWPCTLYVCINQADASAFKTITALLFETMSLSLLSTGPREFNGKTQRWVGPFAVCMLLDEFAKMPKIDAVIEGPDLGRSKKVSYWLIAQSDGQIEKIYSKDNLSIIYSTTAVKIVFAQNDNDTINKIIAMAGKTTIRRASTSGEQGLHVQHWWKQNVSDQHEETDLLRSGDVSGMPVGTHLAFVQRFNNRPMRLETPLWYLDAELSKRGYNDRARTGPRARDLLPVHISSRRAKDHREVMARIAANQLQILMEADTVANIDADELESFDD